MQSNEVLFGLTKLYGTILFQKVTIPPSFLYIFIAKNT